MYLLLGLFSDLLAVTVIYTNIIRKIQRCSDTVFYRRWCKIVCTWRLAPALFRCFVIWIQTFQYTGQTHNWIWGSVSAKSWQYSWNYKHCFPFVSLSRHKNYTALHASLPGIFHISRQVHAAELKLRWIFVSALFKYNWSISLYCMIEIPDICPCVRSSRPVSYDQTYCMWSLVIVICP